MDPNSTSLSVGDRCKILKTRGKPPAWINSVAVVAEVSEDGKTVRADIENQPGLRYSFKLDWLEHLPPVNPSAEPQQKVEDSEKAVKDAEAPKPATKAPKPTEPAKEPYLYSQCTITVGIQLLPDDGSGDRPVIVGVRNHADPPLLRMMRQSQLGELPPVVAELLQELRMDLPRRAEAYKTKPKRPTANFDSQAKTKAQPGAVPRSPTSSAGTGRQNAALSAAALNAHKQTQMTIFDALTPGG